MTLLVNSIIIVVITVVVVIVVVTTNLFNAPDATLSDVTLPTRLKQCIVTHHYTKAL